MLLVFLRSRTSWSKLLIWDLPHRPVSCCVSVLQCLGRAGKRRKARGNHKRWKHVFKLNVFKYKRKHNENEEIHSDISSVGTDPGQHYFTWITLAYHCSLRLPMGCRTDNTFSSSLSSVFRHVFEFYNVSTLHFTHSLILLIYISCIVDLVCVFFFKFVLKQICGFTGAQPVLTAQSSMTVVTLATVVYDPINAPAADPKNQLELTLVRDTATLWHAFKAHSFPIGCQAAATFYSVGQAQVNPQIAAAVDLTLQGELINAAIDPELHPDLRSANAWILDLAGQSLRFCRVSLHVAGFIRFLELWNYEDWIGLIGFSETWERKQDLNLSDLWLC